MKSKPDFFSTCKDWQEYEKSLICAYLRKASEVWADVTNPPPVENILEDLANKIERGSTTDDP